MEIFYILRMRSKHIFIASVTERLVHELGPKKWLFGSSGWTNYIFLVTSGCLLSRKA